MRGQAAPLATLVAAGCSCIHSEDWFIATPKRAIALAALILIVFTKPAWPTTVVVLYTSEGVVVAADSRTSKWGLPPFGTDCKVRVSSGMVASGSGIGQESGTGFNLGAELQYAVGHARSPGLAADLAQQRITPKLLRISDLLMRQDEQQYFAHLAFGRLTFFVAGMSSPGILVAARSLPESRGRSAQAQDIRVPAGQIGRLLLGETKAIQQYIDQTPNWIDQGDMVTKAVRFVEIEAKAEPNWVGEPVTVLYIDKGGVHWLNRGACR